MTGGASMAREGQQYLRQRNLGPTLGTQFLLWNFGVLGQALGAIVRAWGWGDALIAAASLVVLAAALLMLAMFYRHARGDRLVLSTGRTGQQSVRGAG